MPPPSSSHPIFGCPGLSGSLGPDRERKHRSAARVIYCGHRVCCLWCCLPPTLIISLPKISRPAIIGIGQWLLPRGGSGRALVLTKPTRRDPLCCMCVCTRWMISSKVISISFWNLMWVLLLLVSIIRES